MPDTMPSRRGQVCSKWGGPVAGPRVALLVAAAIMLSCSAGSAWGQFQLFDNFEDEITGAISGQDGWYSSGSDISVELDPAAPENQVLYVPSSSSILRKHLLVEDLAVPDGTMRTLFMRMRVAEKQTYSVGLSPYSFPSEYSDFANELGMANSAPNLDLRVWDDDGDNYQVLTQLTADTWYNIWILVDTALNHCQIWLNESPAGYATAADKLSAPDGDETFEFRSGDHSSMATFYIKTSGGGSGFGPVYFDDIYLEVTTALNLGNPAGPPTGDCNDDGLVGLADVADLGTCLLGPQEPTSDGCRCLDTECDADVDLRDVALLQVNFTG